jgi:apolipoprotein N-acyltransferase
VWAFLGALHVMSLIGLYWLKGQATASWLVAPLLYYPQFLPGYVLPVLVRRRWPAFPLAVLWPLVFTGCEWLRIRLSPGELALCVLGYSQVVFPKAIQVVDVTGVLGVSFACAAVAGLVAEALLSLGSTDPLGHRLRRLAPQAVFVAGLWVAMLAYGAVRDTEAHFSTGPTVHVVQSALPRSPDPDLARKMYDVLVLQTLSTARPGAVDAILWPENSIMVPLLRREGGLDPGLGPDVVGLARRLRAPILVDGPSMDQARGRSYHAAVLIRPDGTYESYDKVRLLPWTEYLPLQGFFGLFGEAAVQAWTGFVRQFVGFVPTGTEGELEDLRVFHLRTRDGRDLLFGTPICFEIATARVVNRWHRQGAHFLVNQTSEGLLGDGVHEQTLTVSAFRAIEGRVSVVRATNDGISAVIDPNGRIREMLRGRVTGSPINEGGVFYPQVILDSRRGTFYARHGDWLPVGSLVVSLLLAGAAWLRGLRGLRAD